MSTTAKKTTKKKTALAGVVKTEKKITATERKKVVEDISKSINRNMALHLLYNRLYTKK